MEIVKEIASEDSSNIHISNLNGFDMDLLPAYCKRDFYKVLYVKKGSFVRMDFRDYHVDQDSIFILSTGQYFDIGSESEGILLFFHPNFYCIALHDDELGCDGILFDNVFENTIIKLENEASAYFVYLLEDIRKELERKDYWTDEMARTYLKQLIIAASRHWFRANPEKDAMGTSGSEFSRKFSQMVERHFSEYHSVSDYAAMLYVTPKTLNRRIVEQKKKNPNEIIKDRIILEAKRLLLYTDLSIKEIASQLGYDDVSYFTRFIKIRIGITPQSFRNENS